MAQYRMQVIVVDSDEIARDNVVNTFYLDTDALSGADDPDQLAADAAALWAGTMGWPVGFSRIDVKAYDLSDPKPREVKGEGTAPITSALGGAAPREVCLCLSYFAGRNLPRLRGRMYIGPWRASQVAERPTATNRQVLATLAEGISGLGGINVQWVQYSPTTGVFTNVSDYWIDDEWDTQRSRGLSPTTRTTGTVSG